MCTRCDDEVHDKTPCHDREVWNGTHFTSIPPTISINQETSELITIRMFSIINMQLSVEFTS